MRTRCRWREQAASQVFERIEGSLKYSTATPGCRGFWQDAGRRRHVRRAPTPPASGDRRAPTGSRVANRELDVSSHAGAVRVVVHLDLEAVRARHKRLERDSLNEDQLVAGIDVEPALRLRV